VGLCDGHATHVAGAVGLLERRADRDQPADVTDPQPGHDAGRARPGV
jgi:hypothetical protein